MKTKGKIRLLSLSMLFLLTIILIGCSKPTQEETQNQSNTVTDIEGNVYKTVTIGTQVWMAENLKVTQLNDGTAIPDVTANSIWSKLTTPAYCWYKNEISNKNGYGALYNWYTVNTGKLCPTGWHVPSVTEFTTLANHLGGESIAGGKLKEKGYIHWARADDITGPAGKAGLSNATNESGFTALPAGTRYANSDDFCDLKYTTSWWTVTQTDNSTATEFGVDYFGDSSGFYTHAWKAEGNSVRCIKGTVNPSAEIPLIKVSAVTNITANSATIECAVISDGGSSVTSRGVCWSTSTLPTIADSKITYGNGIGSFIGSISGLNSNTTYYVRAYASNSIGTAYDSENLNFKTSMISGLINDVDGNTYKTINIGTQTWMAENLKTTKYKDGSSIPLITDNSSWPNLTTPAYCWYNNDATTNKSIYGALYNWYTVNTGKLCPTGWHAPSLNEWTALINYLGGMNAAGEKLKEQNITHWIFNNSLGTNTSGFTALPGGQRDDKFNYMGSKCFFWASSTGNSDLADRKELSNDSKTVYGGALPKKIGHSIRCLKD